MRTVLLAMLLGCSGPDPKKSTKAFTASPPTTTDDTGTWEGESFRVSGLQDDAGFGSTVLVAGGRIWASAPHGSPAQVFEITDGRLKKVAQGPGRLGSSLARSGGDLWMGAPLTEDGTGSVVDSSGTAVVPGIQSTGIALASADVGVVAHSSGYSVGSGAITPTLGRPTSIAWNGTDVGVGMASGGIALQVGSRTLSRPGLNDEAGFALSSGDVDGDGVEEWLLGAPAASSVHIVDPATLTLEDTIASESGGFGAAICAADFDGDGIDELLIGAPSADLTKGRAMLYRSTGGTLTLQSTWTGDAVGDRLGTSVDCSAQAAAIGAPGTSTSTGYVQVEAATDLTAAWAGSASRPARPQ